MSRPLVLPDPFDVLRALEHELFAAGWFNPEQLFQRLDKRVRRAGGALTIQYAEPWWIGHSLVDWWADVDGDHFTPPWARADQLDDEWFAENLDTISAEPVLMAFSEHVAVASRGTVRVVKGADTPIGRSAVERFDASSAYAHVGRLIAFTYHAPTDQ